MREESATENNYLDIIREKVKTRGKSSRFLQATAGKGKPYGLKGQISFGISGSLQYGSNIVTGMGRPHDAASNCSTR